MYGINPSLSLYLPEYNFCLALTAVLTAYPCDVPCVVACALSDLCIHLLLRGRREMCGGRGAEASQPHTSHAGTTSGIAWLCSLGQDSSACASTEDFDVGQGGSMSWECQSSGHRAASP